MYAIVEIAGQQFKVEKNQQIFVHRLDSKEGDKVTFNNVLLDNVAALARTLRMCASSSRKP